MTKAYAQLFSSPSSAEQMPFMTTSSVGYLLPNEIALAFCTFEVLCLLLLVLCLRVILCFLCLHKTTCQPLDHLSATRRGPLKSNYCHI